MPHHAAGDFGARDHGCAACHYPNGKGRPQNASLAGLNAATWRVSCAMKSAHAKAPNRASITHSRWWISWRRLGMPPCPPRCRQASSHHCPRCAARKACGCPMKSAPTGDRHRVIETPMSIANCAIPMRVHRLCAGRRGGKRRAPGGPAGLQAAMARGFAAPRQPPPSRGARPVTWRGKLCDSAGRAAWRNGGGLTEVAKRARRRYRRPKTMPHP